MGFLSGGNHGNKKPRYTLASSAEQCAKKYTGWIIEEIKTKKAVTMRIFSSVF